MLSKNQGLNWDHALHGITVVLDVVVLMSSVPTNPVASHLRLLLKFNKVKSKQNYFYLFCILYFLFYSYIFVYYFYFICKYIKTRST